VRRFVTVWTKSGPTSPALPYSPELQLATKHLQKLLSFGQKHGLFINHLSLLKILETAKLQFLQIPEMSWMLFHLPSRKVALTTSSLLQNGNFIYCRIWSFQSSSPGSSPMWWSRIINERIF